MLDRHRFVHHYRLLVLSIIVNIINKINRNTINNHSNKIIMIRMTVTIIIRYDHEFLIIVIIRNERARNAVLSKTFLFFFVYFFVVVFDLIEVGLFLVTRCLVTPASDFSWCHILGQYFSEIFFRCFLKLILEHVLLRGFGMSLYHERGILVDIFNFKFTLILSIFKNRIPILVFP